MKNPEIACCGVPFGQPNEKEALQKLKDCGATSVQIYVYWRFIEPEKRGEFDWSYYDRQVELIREAGLKWVPFLIFGPGHSFPDWWLKDERHCGFVCLEHGVENRIESIWNPCWAPEVTRLLEAFAEHYNPWNIIESVQPGISGDYGEAIYPGVGNWPGMYHTHYGYWCMDRYAQEDFRRTMKEKYGDIAALNAAWRSFYKDFADIKPFMRHKTPSRTALFDMLMWYKSSMTSYVEFWMKECRRLFPGTPVYMCTGGDEEPYLGADFAEQARVCAKYDGGLRLTNEGNLFYENFDATAHCMTSCDFYGAYAGLEPVGGMIPRGVTARIFGSAAYGNRQIFHYYGNLFDGTDGGAQRVKKYRDLIGERKVKKNVAVFLPLDMCWLEGATVPKNINEALNFVRRQYEADVINETLIEDGVLDEKKVLVMLGAKYARAGALRKIGEWVRNGGTLITDERTTDIEGDYVPEFDAALGFTEESLCYGGITHVVPCLRPWSREFNENDGTHTYFSWAGLSADIHPVLRSVPHKPAMTYDDFNETALLYSCFEREYGLGRGLYYCANLDLVPQEDGMFREVHVYEHILADLLREYAGVKPLGTKPDEIARARVDGRIMVLKKDDISFTDEEE